MIIGIDRGSAYVKNSNKQQFKSTVKLVSDDIIIDKNQILVEYKNSKYIIGEEGNYATDLMKSQNEDTLLLILTMLAQEPTTFLNIDLITGLPIGLYSNQKQGMKELLQNTTHTIIFNNKRKIINIRRCEIFPEGAGVFYSQDQYTNALIIDVGGLSIDVALFENRKLKKYSTYPLGVMKMYNKLANKINGKYDLSLDGWETEQVINNGLTIDGQVANVDSIINNIKEEHIQNIINRLKLDYDLKMIPNILLAGGGSIIHEELKSHFVQATIIKNSQYANAIGYKSVGKALFQ